MAGMSNNAVKIAGGAAAVVSAALALWYFTQSPPPPMAPVPLASQPATTPAEPPAAAAAPAPAPAPAPAIARAAPTLDVVRVEPDGNATVAGAAEAGARVSLRVDGSEVAFAPADAAGAYASLFTLPPSTQPRVLTVVSKATDGVEVAGLDSVILAPTEAATASAIKVDEAGVAVLDAADIANITVDTVTYEGDVIRVGGRGAGGAVVRLYVDNADTASAPIMADGRFSADLAGIAPGTYTLRADQLDAQGKVTSRYETQITKLAPEALVAAAPEPAVIEVVQGTSLWAIAVAKFGDGMMFIQVYEANKDKIRDPDLIYPGQVFEMPDVQ